MKENYKKLLNEFIIISNSKWIHGINNYTNSAGLTFETLLNKKSDSMFFPDYNGIEIKCTQRFSRYPVTLFSKSFEGNSFYEMNRLLNKYGKNDWFYKDKKILNVTLSCNKKTLVNNNYYFKLNLSKADEKLYLEIYDKNNVLIEKEAYISFDTLKSHLELKLSSLAIVWASKKQVDNIPYFRYYKLIIYELTSFEMFIKLIKEDIIIIQLVGRISRSGTERGRQRNKNLIFRISKDNINKLFNIIKIYDNDLKSNFQIF